MLPPLPLSPKILAGLVGGFMLVSCTQLPQKAELHDWSVPERFGAQDRLNRLKPAGNYAPLHVQQNQPGWWSQFKDPVLNQIITNVNNNNQDIKIALTRWQQSNALLAASRNRLWPSLGLNLSYADNDSGLPDYVKRAGKPDYTARLGQLNLDWQPDVFGSTRAQARGAGLDALAAAWGVDAIQQLMVSDAIAQYILLQGNYQRLATLDQILASLGETRKRVLHRYEEGYASRMEVEAITGEIATLEADRPSLKTAIAVGENHLNTLQGIPQGPKIVPVAYEKWLPPQMVAPGQPVEILQRRPDIRVAEAQLLAAGASLEAARRDRYPKLVLSALWGQQSLALNGAAALPYSVFHNAALAFAMPLLNYPQITANIRIKTAQQAAAYEQYEKTVLTALEQVENGLVASQEEWGRQAALQDALKNRQAVYQHMQQLYKNGQIGVIPVYESDRNVLNTRIKLVDSHTQGLLNMVRLYQALGGSFETVPYVNRGRPLSPAMTSPVRQASSDEGSQSPVPPVASKPSALHLLQHPLLQKLPRAGKPAKNGEQQ